MIDVSPELATFIREEYDRCTVDTTINDERETAIKRYHGEPYGDEEEGSSQVVARDTAEAVDYMVISILRTFFSGDDVVEFVHKNAEMAHQATQAIKHLFMDEQDGYTIIHDWLKAGLLEKNAVAMTFGYEQPPKRKVLEGVSPLALMAQEIEPVEMEETGEFDESGHPLVNATIMEPRGPKFCDFAVPNEEFYCSPDARTIDEAAMKGRKVRKSISDLVKMGFDRDVVEALPQHEPTDTLTQARDESRYVTSRTVWLHEEWVLFDANGDGIDELLFIQRVDDTILSIDEMDDETDHPFEDWCPFPMQHRRIGQSLADKTMDIERISTVVLRQSLNGIYLSNKPLTYVHEDSITENTIEDLLGVAPGRLIRWKGQNKPEERSGNFDPSAGFQMMEFLRGELESRTGITRHNQGLESSGHRDATATGNMLQAQLGQQVEEYLARNFANAVARLFTKKAKLLKRFGNPITVPIDGEFVEVDPTQWPEDMIARPRVGLGSGRKEQRIQFRRELIAMQAQAFDVGLPIVGPKEFFNSAKGFVNDAGLGDVTEFFADPEEIEKGPDGQPVVDPETGQPKLKNPPQDKPDPEAEKAAADIQAKQIELQMKQQELEANAQLKQIDLQGKQQEAALKIELARQEAAERAQLERDKAEFEREQAVAQMMFERQMRQQEFEDQRALAREKIAADNEAKKYRDGGRLDA